MSAYILLFLRRIAEIAPEFPTLSVDEKLAVMVNAHNDPEHAYIWAGPLTANILLEADENECTNPVYQLTFPVQVQYRTSHWDEGGSKFGYTQSLYPMKIKKVYK